MRRGNQQTALITNCKAPGCRGKQRKREEFKLNFANEPKPQQKSELGKYSE
jgi:hypothetical protein